MVGACETGSRGVGTLRLKLRAGGARPTDLSLVVPPCVTERGGWDAFGAQLARGRESRLLRSPTPKRRAHTVGGRAGRHADARTARRRRTHCARDFFFGGKRDFGNLLLSEIAWPRSLTASGATAALFATTARPRLANGPAPIANWFSLFHFEALEISATFLFLNRKEQPTPRLRGFTVISTRMNEPKPLSRKLYSHAPFV